MPAQSCGTVQDVLTTIKATGKTGPMAAYAVQGYAPKRDAAGKPYSGRFFSAYDAAHAQQYDTAFAEWEARKDADLKDYWPRSELAYGFMTHHLQGGVPNHGFTHWWTMFNPRQLLVHSLLLRRPSLRLVNTNGKRASMFSGHSSNIYETNALSVFGIRSVTRRSQCSRTTISIRNRR
jgi:hypothetical protein